MNVVAGPRSCGRRRLVEHPLVAKVGFTGSTEVGIEIARKAAGTVKRVTLELGGKSACVVFADADLEKAGRTAPFSVFENAGQDCCARSRLLVEASAKDELLAHYVATTRAIVVGDPEAEGTQMGPLVSAGQRETVEGYIEKGVSEGARVLEGGSRPDGDGLDRGFYLRPTVLDDCTNEMVVSREEIFGPGRVRDHLRERGRGDPDRERHAVRALGLGSGPATARASFALPGRSAPARSASTRTARSFRRRPSGATRHRASGRSSGWKASCTTPS